MATINLLPTELTFKGKDKVVIETIRKLVFVGFLFLIVASLIIAGYLIYASVRIKSSLKNEEVLKSEVSSLQEAEQRYFLIKDRLSKIRAVFAQGSANDQVAPLNNFLQSTAGDFRILEIEITDQKIGLNLIFPSSVSFGNFYKALIDSSLYPNIRLKSFSFNPSAGYLASFELSEK